MSTLWSFISPFLMSQESTGSEYCLSDSVEIIVEHFSISLIFLHHLVPFYLHPFGSRGHEPMHSYISDQFLAYEVLYQINQSQ